MRSTVLTLIVAAGLAASAAAQNAQKPFKLGTFERGGKTFIGVVLDDAKVVDLAAANAALESKGSAKMAMPADMKELITRYESGLKERIYAVANAGAPAGAAYAYDVKALKTLAPVKPAIIL